MCLSKLQVTMSNSSILYSSVVAMDEENSKKTK